MIIPFLQFLLFLFVAHKYEENKNAIERITKIGYNEYFLWYGLQFPFDGPRNHFHRPVHTHRQKQFQIQVESMKITVFQLCFTENSKSAASDLQISINSIYSSLIYKITLDPYNLQCEKRRKTRKKSQKAYAYNFKLIVGIHK